MQIKSITNRILIATNFIFVVLILLAISGSVISPAKFVLPIFFILVFPVIVIINILFVILWISLRKWFFLISLIALLISYKQISTGFPIHFHGKGNESHPNSLVLVSYNTMSFGNQKKHLPNDTNGVIQYLLATNADIICMQEYFVTDNPDQLTQSDIDSLFKNYPYRYVKFDFKNHDGKTGLATFSKYPIIKNEIIKYTSIFNASMYSDIVVNEDTIRVINNHLESNWILGNDLLLPEQLEADFNLKRFYHTIKYLSKKLVVANPIRANQADSIRKIINSTPYKIIVCGDFNDVPNSYSYTTIKGDLKDAFVNYGNGFGWTFNSSIYKLRLDYVFYDQNFEVNDFRIGKTYSSDHFPVRCVLSMN